MVSTKQTHGTYRIYFCFVWKNPSILVGQLPVFLVSRIEGCTSGYFLIDPQQTSEVVQSPTIVNQPSTIINNYIPSVVVFFPPIHMTAKKKTLKQLQDGGPQI